MTAAAENTSTVSGSADQAEVDKWASKVVLLYEILRADHQVVDVKFAFGTMKGKEPLAIYKAVALALQALIDNKSKKFTGLNDSYGLKAA